MPCSWGAMTPVQPWPRGQGGRGGPAGSALLRAQDEPQPPRQVGLPAPSSPSQSLRAQCPGTAHRPLCVRSGCGHGHTDRRWPRAESHGPKSEANASWGPAGAGVERRTSRPCSAHQRPGGRSPESPAGLRGAARTALWPHLSLGSRHVRPASAKPGSLRRPHPEAALLCRNNSPPPLSGAASLLGAFIFSRRLPCPQSNSAVRRGGRRPSPIPPGKLSPGGDSRSHRAPLADGVSGSWGHGAPSPAWLPCQR